MVETRQAELGRQLSQDEINKFLSSFNSMMSEGQLMKNIDVIMKAQQPRIDNIKRRFWDNWWTDFKIINDEVANKLQEYGLDKYFWNYLTQEQKNAISGWQDNINETQDPFAQYYK